MKIVVFIVNNDENFNQFKSDYNHINPLFQNYNIKFNIGEIYSIVVEIPELYNSFTKTTFNIIDIILDCIISIFQSDFNNINDIDVFISTDQDKNNNFENNENIRTNISLFFPNFTHLKIYPIFFNDKINNNINLQLQNNYIQLPKTINELQKIIKI